jgi:hypothetical protein
MQALVRLPERSQSGKNMLQDQSRRIEGVLDWQQKATAK